MQYCDNLVISPAALRRRSSADKQPLTHTTGAHSPAVSLFLCVSFLHPRSFETGGVVDWLWHGIANVFSSKVPAK